MEALIDGDVLAYRFASSCETATEWEDDIWTIHADMGLAKAKVREFLQVDILEPITYLMELDHTPGYRVFLSDSTNFRKEVWPTYKENRKGKRKPIILQQVREWMIEEFLAEIVEGVEADDLLGMYGCRRKDRVICTIDKDLRTVEGYHFNWDKPDEGVLLVNNKDAAFQFYGQVLTGDSVDNFPGLPGCGPKTAEKLLAGAKSVPEMWERVVKAYEKKGLEEEDAIVQARCAYILKENKDLTDNGVNLWQPPTK